MMWSRTSTANKGKPLGSGGRFGCGVGDELAKYAAPWRKDIGEPRRKVVKFDRRREQRLEPRIRKQVKRGGEPAGQRPAGSVRRCDPADLAGHEPEAAAMERPGERERDPVTAIPA